MLESVLLILKNFSTQLMFDTSDAQVEVEILLSSNHLVCLVCLVFCTWLRYMIIANMVFALNVPSICELSTCAGKRIIDIEELFSSIYV